MQSNEVIEITKDEVVPTAEKMRKEGRALTMVHCYLDKEGLPVVSYDYDFGPVVKSYVVKGEKVLPTISGIYDSAAAWPEREINELMDVTFEGLDVSERLFMPDADMADKMRETGVPLFSLESRAALNEFDIIGFTLQYEMSYTNILEMLDLGRVPIRREDRAEQDTIVVAGGPCAFNPEPLAPFIDAFMIGDGEDVMHELIDVIRDGREAGLSRKDILRNLAKAMKQN